MIHGERHLARYESAMRHKALALHSTGGSLRTSKMYFLSRLAGKVTYIQCSGVRYCESARLPRPPRLDVILESEASGSKLASSVPKCTRRRFACYLLGCVVAVCRGRV